MRVITYSEFSKHLKQFMDKVTDNGKSIVITREDGKNVVLMSEDKYNNMLENQYILGNSANLRWLEEGKKQAENSQIQQHELIEE